MSLTDPHVENGVKGAFHGALFTIAAICLAYNALAWRARKQSHLVVNVGVYSALCGFEVMQVMRHANHD